MFNSKSLDSDLFKFLALTVAFGVIYTLNNWLTPFLNLVPAAHLIHIPSGIKFLIVLLFWLTGALSIATVSLLAGLWVYFPDNYPVSLELALVNAISPLLTLKLFKGSLSLDEVIEQLNWTKLLKMGLLFSLLNSAMNQLVVYWNGVTEDILRGLEVMFIGDITGFYITLSLMKLMAPHFKRPVDRIQQKNQPL